MPVTITPPPSPPASDPAAGQVVAQVSTQPIKPDPSAAQVPIPATDSPGVTTHAGSSIRGATVQPHVRYARPKIAGEVIPDAGEAAEFEVLHSFVGTFPQGSRVKASDFPEGTDFDRLVSLGAVADLRPPAPAEADRPADSPADPAPPKGKAK